jgi:predicted RNA-binding Zn ribbon-like protein
VDAQRMTVLLVTIILGYNGYKASRFRNRRSDFCGFLTQDSSMAEAATIADLPLVAGHPALDFTNTAAWASDRVLKEHLVDYSALLAWSLRTGLIGLAQEKAMRARSVARPREADRVLHRAQELREALHDIFAAHAENTAAPQHALKRLNRSLAEGLVHARIAKKGSAFEWTWEGAPDALDRMLWPVARFAAELLASNQLSRVRQCAGENCGWFFIDTSKNRARRWCSMSDCGNRAKVRRFRERQ